MNDFILIESSMALIGTPEHELSALARNYGGTRESYREESPQHSLLLPSYAIARLPVTNADYAAFVAQAGTEPPIHWHGAQPPAALHNHPVVHVSWLAAQDFCTWRTAQLAQEPLSIAGKAVVAIRLPTEAEWEHAARGSEGRMFPWGNHWEQERANTRESGIGTTQAVGIYPQGASPYGCLDMAGSVWEWTSSLDRLYPYAADDGREDAQASGRRILRGGCYANPHGYARCACRFRMPPTMDNEFLGFRLAATISS